MCLYDDSDPASFYRETMRKARKEHRCAECFRTIKPKETYQMVFGIWEGRPSTHKTCNHCLQAQNWLRENCGGWMFGGIREDLDDHTNSFKVYRFIVGMNRQWRKFKSNDLMKIIT